MRKISSKLFNRFFIWLKILKAFRGLTLKSVFNLLLSAFCDTLLYAFTGASINPRLLLKGLFFFKAKGLGIVAVRGGTDDLYNLLPGREGDVEVYIESHLAEGFVFVDVGANVGYYTLKASKLVGAAGRVYAIEPVPSTAAVLRANVRLNDRSNVIIHKVAAWSARGKLTLSVPGSLYGSASVTREGLSAVTVEALTLDELLRGENRVDLIKIDVEGAELEVLRGAQSVLRKARYVVLELSRNAREVLHVLQGAEFACKRARFTTYVLCERRGLRNCLQEYSPRLGLPNK